MRVVVLHIDRSTIKLDVEPSTKTEDIKGVLRNKYQLCPEDEQHLLYKDNEGYKSMENGRTIESYNIGDNENLWMFPSSRGDIEHKNWLRRGGK